ncbi:MAG: hypothetical protein HY608_04655 [Planctomycetes bacterium]|nr:hypothetical protein [Planctomycetota bacterium]
MLRIEVTLRAAGEVVAAERWWRQNRPAVPGAIADDLRRAFALTGASARSYSGASTIFRMNWVNACTRSQPRGGSVS